MTSPERNHIFMIGPKKEAIKSVSISSLQDELEEVRKHKVREKNVGNPQSEEQGTLSLNSSLTQEEFEKNFKGFNFF